ncbi:MAG: hypothetical protein IIA53_08130 [Chloroflexi bacterium]|nr:hypothetical protein [Chloroflexota bacterium]
MKALYKPIALLSIVSLILASTLTAAPVSADSHDTSHIPRGQLTRRGLTGTVVGMGGSSFVLETKFGNVTISVSGGTIVTSSGEDVGFGAMSVGDRVGVLLDRPPDAPGKNSGGDGGPDLTSLSNGDDTGTEPDLTPPSNGDDTGTEPEPSVTPNSTPEPSFRQGVTALRITIVPSKASRSHKRGVVTSKGNGKIKFLDENGEEQELDGDADAGEGEDVVFIARGRRGGGAEVTGSTDPGDIDDRLTRLAQSNPELAAKITEKWADYQAKRDERLANTLGNAPDDVKDRVQSAIDKKNNRGSGSSDNSGSGNSGRSGNTGRGNSGNSDGGNQGGSNSGSGNSNVPYDSP